MLHRIGQNSGCDIFNSTECRSVIKKLSEGVRPRISEISSFGTMILRTSLVLSILALSPFGRSTAMEPIKELTESMLNFTLRFSLIESDGISRTAVYSPFCILILVAAVQQGAEENSTKQIDALLDFGREDSKSYFRSVLDYMRDSLSDDVFHWGNRMYARNDLKIDEDFRENIEKNFKMTTEKVNFSEDDFAEAMNDWVSSVTGDHIRETIDPTFVTPETFLVLATAIYFSDEWDNAFNVRNTEDGVFQVNDTTNVTVPFMIHKNRDTIMGQNTEIGFRWIRLGYSKSPSMFILIVLPTKRFSLVELQKKLTWAHVLQMMKENKTETANIEIPKFNITTHKTLKTTLKKLGVTDIFDEKANLSGMITSDDNVKIVDISHDCKIEVNEKGTTASSVSSANFQFLSGSMDYPDNPAFRADQPFLFFLYDKNVLLPYFAGKVFNPRG